MPDFKLCECGCLTFIKFWSKRHQRISRFAKGHNSRVSHPMGKYSQELVNYQGYVLVWHNGKRRRKHIVVWEQEHQACLCSWGCVHHKDHNRQNNAPENLEAMMRGKHASVHHKDIPKTREIRQRMRDAALSNHEVMERKRLIMLGNRRWMGKRQTSSSVQS